MFVEPLDCWRDNHVTLRKTAADWSHQLRDLIEHPRYADTE